MTKTKPMTDEWKEELPQKTFVRTLNHNDGEELMEYISNLISQITSKVREVMLDRIAENEGWEESRDFYAREFGIKTKYTQKG